MQASAERCKTPKAKTKKKPRKCNAVVAETDEKIAEELAKVCLDKNESNKQKNGEDVETKNDSSSEMGSPVARSRMEAELGRSPSPPPPAAEFIKSLDDSVSRTKKERPRPPDRATIKSTELVQKPSEHPNKIIHDNIAEVLPNVEYKRALSKSRSMENLTVRDPKQPDQQSGKIDSKIAYIVDKVIQDRSLNAESLAVLGQRQPGQDLEEIIRTNMVKFSTSQAQNRPNSPHNRVTGPKRPDTQVNEKIRKIVNVWANLKHDRPLKAEYLAKYDSNKEKLPYHLAKEQSAIYSSSLRSSENFAMPGQKQDKKLHTDKAKHFASPTQRERSSSLTYSTATLPLLGQRPDKKLQAGKTEYFSSLAQQGSLLQRHTKTGQKSDKELHRTKADYISRPVQRRYVSPRRTRVLAIPVKKPGKYFFNQAKLQSSPSPQRKIGFVMPDQRPDKDLHTAKADYFSNQAHRERSSSFPSRTRIFAIPDKHPDKEQHSARTDNFSNQEELRIQRPIGFALPDQRPEQKLHTNKPDSFSKLLQRQRSNSIPSNTRAFAIPGQHSDKELYKTKAECSKLAQQGSSSLPRISEPLASHADKKLHRNKTESSPNLRKARPYFSIHEKFHAKKMTKAAVDMPQDFRRHNAETNGVSEEYLQLLMEYWPSYSKAKIQSILEKQSQPHTELSESDRLDRDMKFIQNFINIHKNHDALTAKGLLNVHPVPSPRTTVAGTHFDNKQYPLPKVYPRFDIHL